MQEQQSTGCKTADETIERARKRGLTVEVSTDVRESSTVVRVEFGTAVPEYAKGTALERSSTGGKVGVGGVGGGGVGARGGGGSGPRAGGGGRTPAAENQLPRTSQGRHAMDAV
ncbi:hypothetical protein, partial [Streptomyces sp. NPDC056670]|uniref:hypothetical protein n=1 Tax=Streptomyces sp. NPDC056670 TaxID=3345904 RepID=UPI00369C1641